MKPAILVHSCWALIAIFAYALGSFNSKTSSGNLSMEAGSAAKNTGERTANKAQDVDVGSAVFTEAVPLAESLTGPAACGGIFEALREPRRTARMGLLMQSLSQITTDNWLDVVNAWIQLVHTKGPLNEDEWDLMLERVGEVAGANAMATALELKTREVLPGLADDLADLALKGWVSREPQKAVEWYRSQPDDIRQKLAQPLMTGLARSNPKEALMLATEQPVSTWPDKIVLILGNAEQSAGLHGGEELLLENTPQIPELFKAVLFEQVSAKMHGRIAVRNLDPTEALIWLEPYVGRTFVGSKTLGDLVSLAVHDSGPATLNWLDHRVDQLTPTQTEAAYKALGESWHRLKPEQFLEWVRANRTHPHLSTIIASVPSAAASSQ